MMEHIALLNTFEDFLAVKVAPNVFYRMLFDQDGTKLKVKVRGYIDGGNQMYHLVCGTIRKHIQKYELIKVTTDQVTITIDCSNFIEYLNHRCADYIRSHSVHLKNNDLDRFFEEAKGNRNPWEYANIVDMLNCAGIDISKYM